MSKKSPFTRGHLHHPPTHTSTHLNSLTDQSSVLVEPSKTTAKKLRNNVAVGNVAAAFVFLAAALTTVGLIRIL
jgi:hypothetical protein